MNPKRAITLNVNGVDRTVAVAPQAVLLDVLREELKLTGTKRGCDLGTCGCCTVQIDGEARLSCLTLALQAVGRRVQTIEALGSPGNLHPLQKAFSDVGGSQCGFCTPGFIMTTKALLETKARPSREEIRQAVSGNLCRCTGYIKILEAVETAAEELARAKPSGRPLVAATARGSES